MDREAELSALFSALKHTQRRAMAELVFRSKTVRWAEVISTLRLSPDVASKGLERLRGVGLVVSVRCDRALMCKAGSGLSTLDVWFGRLLTDYPDEREASSSLDGMFQLLSDPGRRRLLEQVSQRPASTVGALAASSRLRPDASSRKLKALAAAGCVRMERRGREIVCSLNPPSFVEAWDWVYYTNGG